MVHTTHDPRPMVDGGRTTGDGDRYAAIVFGICATKRPLSPSPFPPVSPLEFSEVRTERNRVRALGAWSYVCFFSNSEVRVIDRMTARRLHPDQTPTPTRTRTPLGQLHGTADQW